MIGINIIIKFCTEAKPELIKQIIDWHTLTHFLYKKKIVSVLGIWAMSDRAQLIYIPDLTITSHLSEHSFYPEWRAVG